MSTSIPALSLSIKSNHCHVGSKEEIFEIDLQLSVFLEKFFPLGLYHLSQVLSFIVERFLFCSLDEVGMVISNFCFLLPIKAVVIDAKQVKRHSRFNHPKKYHFYKKDWIQSVENKIWGSVIIIYQNALSGLYQLQIAPQASIPLHLHRVLNESELILTSGLLLQHQPVAAGTAIHWEKEFAHVYENSSEVEQKILCIDVPIFVPEDEVLAESSILHWPHPQRMKKYW